MAIWNTYITAIWYIVWPFGNLVAVWNIFSPVLVHEIKKSGNPALSTHLLLQYSESRSDRLDLVHVVFQNQVLLDTVKLDIPQKPAALLISGGFKSKKNPDYETTYKFDHSERKDTERRIVAFFRNVKMSN
jgi:hypothetical protein